MQEGPRKLQRAYKLNLGIGKLERERKKRTIGGMTSVRPIQELIRRKWLEHRD